MVSAANGRIFVRNMYCCFHLLMNAFAGQFKCYFKSPVTIHWELALRSRFEAAHLAGGILFGPRVRLEKNPRIISPIHTTKFQEPDTGRIHNCCEDSSGDHERAMLAGMRWRVRALCGEPANAVNRPACQLSDRDLGRCGGGLRSF
jgi:hypothetical protein